MLVYFSNPRLGSLPAWLPRFPLYLGLNASAVVAILVGIRRWRPEHALPWWLLAVGQAVYTAGDFLFYWARYISHVNQFPSLADAFYLGRVPFVVLALALVIHRRSGRDRIAVIDSLILGVAVGLLSWVFLMAPYTKGSLGLSARLTSLAYPVTDLMMAAMAIRLLVGGGRRARSFYFLTGGLILLALTDSLYGWLNLHGVTYGAGSVVEAGWLLYYLTVGASALDPTMRSLNEPLAAPRGVSSRARLAVLAIAALVVPVILAVEAGLKFRAHTLPFAVGSIVLCSCFSDYQTACSTRSAQRLRCATAKNGFAIKPSTILSAAWQTGRSSRTGWSTPWHCAAATAAASAFSCSTSTGSRPSTTRLDTPQVTSF
jgi:hypothetical protein